jgi:O-antigen ligase
MPKNMWKERWKWILSAAIIFISSFVLSGSWRRFEELLNAGYGGDGRMMHWRVFYSIFMDHPIFGIGPGTPKQAISAYYIRLGGDDKIMLAHNAFLQFAAEYGVIGLMGFLYLLFKVFASSCAMHQLRGGAFALFGVLLLGALTQNNIQDSQFVFAFILWFSISALIEVRSKYEQSGRNKIDNFIARKSGENADAHR